MCPVSGAFRSEGRFNGGLGGCAFLREENKDYKYPKRNQRQKLSSGIKPTVVALSLLLMLPTAHIKDGGVRIVSFRKWIPTPPSPCPRFTRSLAVSAQDSGPSRSLVFTRKALSSSTSCRSSGKAMARTGLRMMPTFPSPPLKFRTAGFPQYGFKAGLSKGAYPA